MIDNAIVVTLVSFATLLLAYRFYGRFLAQRVFQLDPTRPTPAHVQHDGVDFIPTKTPVLFGHHFASIAGLGPILGPAIAVIWGWVPAVLWVVFGSIFLGAVHDLGALTVSLRYKARSIGDVSQDLIGSRARLLFLVVIFFLMSLAMGAFVNAISSLFVNFNPNAIIPSFGLMLVAMAMGIGVYRLGVGLTPATVLALAAFGGLIYWGVEQPLLTYEWFAPDATVAQLEAGRTAEPRSGPVFESPYGAVAAGEYLRATGHEAAAEQLKTIVAPTTERTWIFTLLGYGFLASILPVWLLLQPRDYINSFQLYVALGLLLLGLIIAGLTGAPENQINAPPLRTEADFAPGDAPPPMIPLLFVTIACGAVSGFHSLVSSGTTVRQLNRETDALPIGFGSMLVEGALAVLVIMACVAGLGVEAWQPGGGYSRWGGISSAGLATQLKAVIDGGANFMQLVGVPVRFGRAFLAVTIVAFALTTLDSATRLLRFNVEEIFRSLKLDALANRYLASLIAVCGIALFGLMPGGKTLWVLFGSGNQVLAGLTLMTVSLFLYKLGRPVIYTILPMVMMLSATLWSMTIKLQEFLGAEEPNWILIGVAILMMVLAVWLIVEGVLSFLRGRGPLNFDGPSRPESDEAREAREAAAAAELG